MGLRQRYRQALVLIFGAVLFTWNASPSEGVVGYRIHVGPKAGQYSQTINVSGGDTLSVEVEVDTTQRKFAALRSVDEWGQVSELSEEISFGGSPLPPFSFKARPAKR